MQKQTIDEPAPGGGRLGGWYDPAFQGVADAFHANFLQHREVGASACVTHKGRVVADLWGGLADAKLQTPWTENTISIVFSCTKGATALCAHILAERGALSLHADVSELWPEFAQNGKARTTLAHMLTHTSPVPHLRAPLAPGGMMDFEYMVGRMADEEAWWEPGTRQGYHGLTYAWTVGTMVRLAAGEPLGSVFRKEVAEPLGLDFHIGLPESEEGRVAPMIAALPSEIDFTNRFFHAVTQVPGSLPQLFLTNTGGADFNSRAMHAAELGSANGITNARGLACLYTPLANGGGGLLTPDTIARIGRVAAATQDDAMLMQPMRFGLGFMMSTDNRALGGDSLILGETGFGHVGMGGSVGFADPEAGLGFGYTMNRMGTGILLNVRGQSLVDAAYRAIGYASDASGAWRLG